ncbi:hypothetical protein CBR_g24289 [Chara braunii]|uniref:Integrase catalytic domain-containing protein n=1 Tax=Chara braunii TaxID=69332 RepID=A0A388JMB6_CHABU|nr:hypothetical protein CBR_g24289 [Chara braunii]|eukprot:GBG58938.1 hypothetical protein CBR_g24289 [Chara braunii]
MGQVQLDRGRIQVPQSLRLLLLVQQHQAQDLPIPGSRQGGCSTSHQVGKLSRPGGEATPPLTLPDSAALLAASYTYGENADVASPRFTYEDSVVHLVPPLDQPLHVQQSTAWTVSPPSATDSAASPPTIVGDSTSWSRLEELDPLTFADFEWMPFPPSGRLLKPHCNVLMAQLRDYLHTVVPAPLMDAGVEVVDLHDYVAKIDLEFKTQRYDNNDMPLLYIRIQIGEATCNALIDCGATCNYISQDFMVRAGLGPRVRRKLQPTQVTLADGHTHKSIERCIDSVPVYFTPHASEAVSFDILDTQFDMTLGMSWLRSEDHPVKFYGCTVHVPDRNGVLVPCTVPPPHPSISCRLVSAASIRASITRDDIEGMGVCFLHALPPHDIPSTDASTDPGITKLLDAYDDMFEAPHGVVPDHAWLHLPRYYQRFITGYSRIATPLTRVQSPKVPFIFDDDARRSFQALKTTMLMAPVLSIYDPTLPTRVTTDAFGYGIGAVLEQHDGDDWHSVEYFSHKVPPINSLNDERKKELLAFVMALKRWRHFPLGRGRFTWVTNNNPLTYYKMQDTVSSTIGRWMYFIDQFDFTPKHLAGLSNRAADALSHGVPKDIVNDCDTRFMSAFSTSLMQESGTKMKPSSARHPQTDGQTERAHQTAQMMLRTLIRSDQKDWVDRLLDIEFAYNTLLHPAIGVTPFELHHGGRKGRIFADLLLPRPADIDDACSPASVQKYRELLAHAGANMQKAQVRMQQQANRRRVPCPIRSGDLVWVSVEEFALQQDVLRKLLPKWFGPWTVRSVAGDEPDGPSFVIDIPQHLLVHPVFHTSKLATYTPAKSDDFPGRRSQDPPSMDGHQEVDRIITDSKYGSKPRQDKVTLKTCDPDDTQWISGADLKASAPLIYANYERQRLAKDASRPAPPTRTLVPPSDRQLRPRR